MKKKHEIKFNTMGFIEDKTNVIIEITFKQQATYKDFIDCFKWRYEQFGYSINEPTKPDNWSVLYKKNKVWRKYR